MIGQYLAVVSVRKAEVERNQSGLEEERMKRLMNVSLTSDNNMF